MTGNKSWMYSYDVWVFQIKSASRKIVHDKSHKKQIVVAPLFDISAHVTTVALDGYMINFSVLTWSLSRDP